MGEEGGDDVRWLTKYNELKDCIVDNDGTYVPSKDEAYFMLVSCSTFINYLRRKAAP